MLPPTEVSVVIILTLNRFIPIHPLLFPILIIILSEAIYYLVLESISVVVYSVYCSFLGILSMHILPKLREVVIIVMLAVRLPWLGGISFLRVSNDILAGSAPITVGESSSFKAVLKVLFGYTLDRHEALRYLRSLPDALMSPFLMKACYSDIFAHRLESRVYLKTVWAVLKMVLGESLTQQQVNALLQGIPSTVYTVAQEDICPAIASRLSRIFTYTIVGTIMMIVLTCYPTAAFIVIRTSPRPVLRTLESVLDAVARMVVPDGYLFMGLTNTFPSSNEEGDDCNSEVTNIHPPSVAAVSGTSSGPTDTSPPAMASATVQLERCSSSRASDRVLEKGKGLDTTVWNNSDFVPEAATQAFAASNPSSAVPFDEHTRPSPSLPGSGIDSIAMNPSENDPESDDEKFIYVDHTQNNHSIEATSPVEGLLSVNQSMPTVEGLAQIDSSGIAQSDLLEDHTVAQSEPTIEGQVPITHPEPPFAGSSGLSQRVLFIEGTSTQPGPTIDLSNNSRSDRLAAGTAAQSASSSQRIPPKFGNSDDMIKKCLDELNQMYAEDVLKHNFKMMESGTIVYRTLVEQVALEDYRHSHICSIHFPKTISSIQAHYDRLSQPRNVPSGSGEVHPFMNLDLEDTENFEENLQAVLREGGKLRNYANRSKKNKGKGRK